MIYVAGESGREGLLQPCWPCLAVSYCYLSNYSKMQLVDMAVIYWFMIQQIDSLGWTRLVVSVIWAEVPFASAVS